MKDRFVLIPNGRKIIGVVLSFFVLFTCAYLSFSIQIVKDVIISSNDDVYSAYYHGNTQKKRATIMFNVYWGNEYIDSILEILKKNNIKTTFFIGGIWAEKYPDVLRKIVDDGHEIGSHGYSHKDHSKLNYEENIKEMRKAEEIIKSITNQEITLFAPPSGYISEEMFKACEYLGYKTIMWSNDTVDWRDKNAKLIYKRAIKNASGGELILMHPTEKTVEALQEVINRYHNNGFRLTTVGENLS